MLPWSRNVAGLPQYPYPSHVNAASFLSIKLSGVTNYRPWQEQMMCLVESHDMLCFINGTLEKPHENNIDHSKKKAKNKEWKRSDTLVKGWIFGSLSEDVMDVVVGLHTACDVWKKLKTTYSPVVDPTATIKNDLHREPIIYRAILNGDWKKVQEIFSNDKDALTSKIIDNNESPLHVAIGTCKNIRFLEDLLNEIDPETLPTLVTNRKSNTLHRAALVGNTKAAKLLVEKNPSLLFLVDNQKYLPIHRAIFGSHRKTFLYLLDATKRHIGISQQDGYQSPFEGMNSVVLLTNVIAEGLLDIAYELIKEYPYMARAKKGYYTPLRAIAKSPYVIILLLLSSDFLLRLSVDVLKENNIDNTDEIQDIESQDTHKAKYVAKYMTRNSFHPGVCPRNAAGYLESRHVWSGYYYKQVDAVTFTKQDVKLMMSKPQKMIYVKFLEVALLHVPHIKHLHEEKVKHNKARTVLKCICEEVGKIDGDGNICEHYDEAITVALENDIPEAIEEIVTSFPEAIWTKHNDYYLTQFVIINRCEKVYNLLAHHEMVIDKHLHKVRIDKDGNNLLHLAGKLAPIGKLNVVSGAALQMQRGITMEVKKFVILRHNRTKNKNQETPIMVFRREHKDLRKEGEEWMKKTADSYTITAALIITIVFAAAITEKKWILIPIAALTCLPIASFVTLQLPLLADLIYSTYGHGIFGKDSVACRIK
ncbi:hypothetical protein OSB04_012787 [Centaurea solstitialis]|uniref:Uncharacterized protein n=1 Tax=Centaurea solstitialis TaxID=347529 RepID=A0AA38TWR8_9ASTR|nr:hypothetical protein OSB04_012787 [Centaurea solstitialis]